MRRIFLASLVALLWSTVALAQYTPPTLDIYGGYTATTCTNTSTAFQIVTINNHKVFCDPLGHIFYLRGPFTFDLNLITTPDESGNGFNNYVTTKYGGTATWITQDTKAMQGWGWNALGSYANANARPWLSGQPVPFIAMSNLVGYSFANTNHPTSCVEKDLYYTMGYAGNPSTWGGYINGGGNADFIDPCYQIYHANFLANDSAYNVGSQTIAWKHYLIGISDADADNTHGMGAGPDFPAANGNTDFRLGYTGFFVSPLEYADSHWGVIYTTGTVYMKKTFHDQVIAAHTNIAGVNASWGSSYTTDLTSGTCFGSLQPSWLCPSPGSAVTLSGSGTGPYTGTLSGTVSKFSTYVALAGVIGGGDTGTGNIYGKGCGGMTGTINYSTGVISVTCTTTPGTVTVGYVKNGWGIGTGFMDEDCRSGHSSYCGTGSGSVTQTLTGIPTNVQTDINALTKTAAQAYVTVGNTDVQSWAATNGFTGHVLYLGVTAAGSWGAPPDRYVLQGWNGNVDAIMSSSSGVGFSYWNQGMLDFVNAYAPGLPLIETSYRTANAQSAFSWPNSACTHSGANVTCTVATPNKFSALAGNSHIDTNCTFPDYNRSNIGFTATSNTVTYTAGGTPAESSATCNVYFDDSNEFGFSSQAARGADYLTDQEGAMTRAYTSSGVKPIIGMLWWGWQDNWAEQLNWGVVDVRDNPYDYNGTTGDDVTPTQACVFNPGFTCGGDLALHGTPMGTVIGSIQTTSTFQDNYMLGLLSGTYYVDYANGNDSWDGTTKTFVSGTTGPWKTVKGMANSSGVAAAHTAQPGDTFVFKGGVTWDWHIWPFGPQSGNSSTSTVGCQGTGCVTYTRDPTWYDAAGCAALGYTVMAECRPRLDGGGWLVFNTTANYDQKSGTTNHTINAAGKSYFIIDGFDFANITSSNGTSDYGYGTYAYTATATNYTFSNNYFHAGLFPSQNVPSTNCYANPTVITSSGNGSTVMINCPNTLSANTWVTVKNFTVAGINGVYKLTAASGTQIQFNAAFNYTTLTENTSCSPASACATVVPTGDYWSAITGATTCNVSDLTGEMHDNVVDGSDATNASNGQGWYTGKGAYGAPNNAYRNIFKNITQALDPGCQGTIHDNVFNNASALSISLVGSGAGVHPHLVNDTNGFASTQPLFYNNQIDTVTIGQGYQGPSCPTCHLFVFNNISSNLTLCCTTAPGVSAGSSNGMYNLAGSYTLDLFNNTCEGGSDTPAPVGGCYNVAGTTNFRNNHTISGIAGNVYTGTPGVTGGSIVQTQAVANGQGYTYAQAQQFSPTSPSNITHSSPGVNLSTLCATITDASASAACLQSTTYGPNYDATNHTVLTGTVLTPLTRPTNWDVGAYQLPASGGSPIVSLLPASLSFTTNQTTTSAGQTVTLQNTGAGTLVVSSVTITGFFSQVNTCGGTSFSLGVGASCTFTVKFSPNTTGPFSGSLTLSDNATGSPHVVTLSGTGTAPVISLTPSSYAFGNVNIPGPANSSAFTLQNTGNGPLAVALSFGGTNPTFFGVASTTCPGILTAGNSCTIVVSFSPAAAISYSATLVETDSTATSSPVTSTLTGTGVTAATPVVAPLPWVLL